MERYGTRLEASDSQHSVGLALRASCRSARLIRRTSFGLAREPRCGKARGHSKVYEHTPSDVLASTPLFPPRSLDYCPVCPTINLRLRTAEGGVKPRTCLHIRWAGAPGGSLYCPVWPTMTISVLLSFVDVDLARTGHAGDQSTYVPYTNVVPRGVS
jgi:hypothetical protein